MKEKIMELCKNEEFAKKLNCLKTEGEVVAFLKEQGVEVASLEELKNVIAPKEGELSEKELAEVSGGGLCFILGIGLDITACCNSGASVLEEISGEDLKSEGIGATACIIVGVGAGIIGDTRIR